MRRFAILSLTVLIVLALSAGVGISQKDANSQVKVATTIIPLGEFVRAVGGDRVQVTVLVPPGTDPHTFEFTPSQIQAVADADVYMENGAGLEAWMDSILKVNPHMLVIDTSKGVSLITGTEGDTGEINAADTHIWLSPRDAMIQVRNICDGLIQIDPSGKDYYINNRDNYIKKLKDLDAYLNGTFAGKKEKKFIVLHPAWTYFARDYSLTQIAIEAEEKEPGPRYLGEVVDIAKANNITTVFVEPQYNPKSAEVIANEINGKVATIDDLARNYIDNLRSVGEKIAQSLR
ncbi:MAG: metal ABC transporter solute-binding protein, Zn/Mn family [Methanotrichaceae archaeon]